MRNNSQDETLKRNYLQHYQSLVQEYLLIKEGKHLDFERVGEFYARHHLDHRVFLKYVHRFLQSKDPNDLLPRKRGPRYKTGRPTEAIERQALLYREQGLNRYEIHNLLKAKLGEAAPSPAGVYNICRRFGMNRLSTPMKEEKRKLIKEKAGEMAHIDCHHLSKCLVMGVYQTRYLLCVIDSCTRVAWAEVLDDIKGLTVMFATLRCLNNLSERYALRFTEVLTDNGPEMGSRNTKDKSSHPLERLWMELGIKHRYTRAYRPQTNGKVERFWRTLEDELLRETTFDSIEELKKELLEYLIYYNHHRPHQALAGKTPEEFNKTCPRNG